MVSLAARVGRSEMSVKKVLLCSSVGTVVGFVYIFILQEWVFVIYFRPDLF